MKPQHEATRKRVRYEAPGVDEVIVRRGVPYNPGADRTLDLYYPPRWTDGQTAPGVILVSGIPDPGAQQFLGCRINEMESFISWGRLLAASGLIGITHTTGADPAKELIAVLRYVVDSGREIGIDAGRVGLWASSSHVPNALGLLIAEPTQLRCAVLCYGFMLDLDGVTGVAEAQRVWRFANPAAGKSIDVLPPDVPLFIARAGLDAFPQVNPSIDAFVVHALRRNLPITVVNHHRALHAFDLDDESAESRRVVHQILTFLQAKLSA